MRTARIGEIMQFGPGDQVRIDYAHGASSCLEIKGLGVTASQEIVIATNWEAERRTHVGWRTTAVRWQIAGEAPPIYLPIGELGVIGHEPQQMICLYGPLTREVVTMVKQGHELWLPPRLINFGPPPQHVWRPH